MSSRTAIFSQSHPRKIKITWGKALSWTAIILTLIIILFPFWWVVRTCLSTQREMLANPEAIGAVGLTTVNHARGVGQVDWPSSPALSTPESPADTPDAAAPVPLAQRAQRRFGRWHRSLRADAANFDAMTETEVHALRKRVKRQRYALEFFAPLLDPAQTAAYLEVLAQLQDRLGTLNDLFVAREPFQSQPQVETSAWLALGWLAPRLVESRAQVKPALQRLARCKPPSARAGKR